LARAGFGLAAGIPFQIHGFKGIVIFFANPHTDGRKLRDNSYNFHFKMLKCSKRIDQ
jgi:hypothetical protein